METREETLERLLSEGLDLCVRARKMDAMDRRTATLEISNHAEAWLESGQFDRYVELHNIENPAQPIHTKSGTPAIWMLDQYEKDLADWEKRARSFLLNHATPKD